MATIKNKKNVKPPEHWIPPNRPRATGSRVSYSSKLSPILLPRSQGEFGAMEDSPNSGFNSELYLMFSSTYHKDQSVDHKNNSPQNKQPL